MQTEISDNTKAILMLTGQLVRGGQRPDAKPLTAAEYNKLAQWLRKTGNEPSDLVALGGRKLAGRVPPDMDRDRIGTLLMQWFAAGIAVEYWHDRSIWVVSRADSAYPASLKRKLREQSPPLLYGCGSPALLHKGGLAVVGSRNAGERALACARHFGRLAGEAGRTVISGGARGIDRAAMDAALEAGGPVVGVLADNLEKAVLNQEHREPLKEGRLTLVSPFDPSVAFKSWNAMARNKLIYALGDAGLVVDCAHGKGGTWSGAVEQLKKFKSVPVYAFKEGETKDGIRGLLDRGALPWPNPGTPEEMAAVLAGARVPEMKAPSSSAQRLEERGEREGDEDTSSGNWNVPYEVLHGGMPSRVPSPKESLWIAVIELIQGECEEEAKSASEIREALGTERRQTDLWLERMVEEGRLVKKPRPVRYLSMRRY